MRHTSSCAAALAMIWLSLAAAQTTPKKAAPKTTAKKSVVTGAHKGTTAVATKKGTTAGKKAAPKRPAVTWRNRQMAPSPERYHEIQDALVARGFLTSEQATGGWNDASVDALKRFQAQQNLESSGKINSLSLIALGLGPKRETPVMPSKAQVEQSIQQH
ncbi:MAG TPA: peptidoglycan-binding protein [Candidatus Acidoferrum sp.]|nr:peptidoglycan-binding protein [Candidatus Acidoferrum sp.]